MEDQFIQQNDNDTESIKSEESLSVRKNMPFKGKLFAVVAVLFIIALFAFLVINNKSKNTETIGSDNSEQPKSSSSETISGRVYLESSTDNTFVGDEFMLDAVLDTNGYNINLASINLMYDDGLVELVDVDTKVSVMPLSASDQRKNGAILITRGAPGDSDYRDLEDGFTGKRGLFARFVFRALKSGVAEFVLSPETSMYLDDGRGTSMNTELGSFIMDIRKSP